MAGVAGYLVRSAGQRGTSFTKYDMNKYRKQNSLRDNELIIVTWEPSFGTVMQIGNIENLSSGGMGVLIDRPIPIGASITVSYNGEEKLNGIVRGQSPYSDRYLIGIEFTDASKESTLYFQPEFMVQYQAFADCQLSIEEKQPVPSKSRDRQVTFPVYRCLYR